MTANSSAEAISTVIRRQSISSATAFSASFACSSVTSDSSTSHDLSTVVNSLGSFHNSPFFSVLLMEEIIKRCGIFYRLSVAGCEHTQHGSHHAALLFRVDDQQVCDIQHGQMLLICAKACSAAVAVQIQLENDAVLAPVCFCQHLPMGLGSETRNVGAAGDSRR